MSKGHFEFWVLSGDGDEIGTSQKVMTSTGVILQCDHRCSAIDIRHLCEIARKTHNYPVDIVLWEKSAGRSYVIWSARIYWRSKTNGQ